MESRVSGDVMTPREARASQDEVRTCPWCDGAVENNRCQRCESAADPEWLKKLLIKK
jgi:hypothetical protein